MARPSLPVFTRLVEKIKINPITGCWEWQGRRNEDGYGEWTVRYAGGFITQPHRLSFLIFNGYLPKKRDVDHKCRVRWCLNPDHLQDVSHKRNCELRVEVKTHCKNGHELIPANVYTGTRGDRVCKTCRYEKVKLWRERHPEKARQVNRETKAAERRGVPRFKLFPRE